MKLADVLLDPARAGALEVRGSVEAAVLVPLFERRGELHVVFTERRADLRRHPGEISFPGGRRDSSDRDLQSAALREAHEEIGLDPNAVQLLGALQPTPTMVTGFSVYPFVGLIAADLKWAPSEDEVADVLEFSLADIEAGYARRRLVRRGLPIRTDSYVVGRHTVWGATARIVGDLLTRTQPGGAVG